MASETKPRYKTRVLIVEDEKQIRDAFSIILKQAGYEIDLAENGQTGLRHLVVFKPDLILLDMIMPIMNGEEFLKLAKLKANFPNVTTIVLSNLSGKLPLKYTRDYGVTVSILKSSLSPNDLLKVVKNHT